MKTIILSIALFITALGSNANDARYIETMTRSIEVVYKSQAPEEIQQAINALDRVGDAEKTKWEPYYYASFGYLMMATREKDAVKKDAYLDQATAEINKAAALLPNDSEIVTMEGFIYMIRTSVDPAARGQKFSGLAMQSYNKAIALNSENPRAYGMLAQMQFGMARFFNSETTEACATTRKSLEKFGSYKSENPLAPVWGRGVTEELLKQCK
ncbi:hypothetical protein BH09BAC3_BH09BAC3_23670 [soil metagenome]